MTNYAPQHFAQRVNERIGAVSPPSLYRDLRKAIRNPEKWADYVERVMPLQNSTEIWRFRVAQGIFYTIAYRGRPATVLTQNMLNGYKRKAPARRRGQA